MLLREIAETKISAAHLRKILDTIPTLASCRMQAQHVEELKAQIGASGARVVLDLEELSHAVHFLGTCQAGGISIVHCPPYINDWIAKERGRDP